MDKTHDLVAIGSALVDIIAEVEDALIYELGLSKGSMALCDREQCDAIYRKLPVAVEQSGGSAANSMSGFAALGGRGGFIGMLGRDQFGEVFTHDLQALGISYTPVYSSNGEASTGRCLVLVSDDAERTMATNLGASDGLDEKSLDEALIASARVVYLEGYSFDSNSNKRAFYKAAKIAQQSGGQVALTLSDGFCVARHRQDFLKFIKDSVDILFANEDELLSLTKASNYNEALTFTNSLKCTAFMTRSEKGVAILHQGGFQHVDPVPPKRLLDSTGAGDQFAAGALYGLLRDKSVAQAANIGCHVASQILAHYGARLPAEEVANLPTLES